MNTRESWRSSCRRHRDKYMDQMGRYWQSRREGLYRSRNGVIAGVCRGIAEHLDFSVFWVRVAVVLAFIFTGFWPIGALYIAAAFFMKPEPVLPLENEEEEEFYNSYVTGRSMALQRLKRTFDGLDRRIQRMENIVTARDYEWDERLKD